MIRRAPHVITPTLVLLSLVVGWAAYGQKMFKLLSENEIRARVIGKDITDSAHWVSYLRPDGVLLSGEMGRHLENPEQQTLHVEPKPGGAQLQ
jgi:hypothetical protein